ncbi:penicillin-binding protein transpeptidase [Catenulispora acidiphila DSM 44928]|uniref:Penicillin-binding protein transpeptidase n=1 Tax=Catenulispora acidiphila (strain DSM 44928 / JCM 14897 / NBRC 102108 / NRRL B-24433 / ID139908) TaxID=479433 RepID=C7Q012_CATAD|nr:penicillin-binding transpeptidase domain-containing protein [Catenulispora acidiphila]ACU75505.1 penicillin-binding protein transpeptidase [Catenulispora acidiphila DSM 44928]
MSAFSKRAVIITTTVVAVAAGGTAVAVSRSGSGGTHKAGVAADGSPGAPVTTTAASASDAAAAPATPPTSGTPTSAAGTPAPSDSGALGAFADDGTTPLTDFPSMVKFSQALGSGSHIVTTIDPKYQRAAADAVSAKPLSGMVVLQADTGKILAMASNGPADLAYHAARAPGSTFKVVTAEALLRGGMTPNSAAPCPSKDKDYPITNDETSTVNLKATLHWGFVFSCNTSFTGLFDKAADTPVSQESTKYFGLNQPWDLGLGATLYGVVDGVAANVPTAKGQDFAAELFGQGAITMSPLNMASVAATVDAGQFHQPYLVTGTKPTAHAQPLGKTVDSELKSMMRDVVTEGTAHDSFSAVTPAVSAKTGTAQATGGEDSWMIAFQGNIAVACLVEGGGFGDKAAGPEIAAMLNAANGH